jgi:hypothetical protein
MLLYQPAFRPGIFSSSLSFRACRRPPVSGRPHRQARNLLLRFCSVALQAGTWRRAPPKCHSERDARKSRRPLRALTSARRISPLFRRAHLAAGCKFSSRVHFRFPRFVLNLERICSVWKLAILSRIARRWASTRRLSGRMNTRVASSPPHALPTPQ